MKELALFLGHQEIFKTLISLLLRKGNSLKRTFIILDVPKFNKFSVVVILVKIFNHLEKMIPLQIIQVLVCLVKIYIIVKTRRSLVKVL